MKKIAIFGAGGFGREVAWLIEDINQQKPEWEFVGFFDDEKKGLGGISELNAVKEALALVVAVGDPKAKKAIVEKIKNPFISFPTLIHPSVIMSKKVSVGEGSIICAGNILTVDITIGKHVIVNLDCTIGHDAIIKDYCSLMPSVNISGETEIGEGTYFGTGALIINQKKVGKNVIIGAGATVVKDLPDNCTAVGTPAKPIKFHE